MPKRRVTFTIDPDIYEAAQTLVSHVPNLSVSSLVELLLRQFVDKMNPVLQAALSGDTLAQIEAFTRFHGQSQADLAIEFTDMIRMIKAKGGETTAAE
jgi:hypothetical protein